MGWYATCFECGAQEKRGPPPCECRDHRESALREKMADYKTIEVTTYANSFGGYVHIHLRKGEADLYVVESKINMDEAAANTDALMELSLEEYKPQKYMAHDMSLRHEEDQRELDPLYQVMLDLHGKCMSAIKVVETIAGMTALTQKALTLANDQDIDSELKNAWVSRQPTTEEKAAVALRDEFLAAKDVARNAQEKLYKRQVQRAKELGLPDPEQGPGMTELEVQCWVLKTPII